MDLSIIIVNWNSKDYVRKCLQSIHANTHGIRFEIIVVDSASYDGCGEMLAREFSSVRFIQSEKNVGFATANNLGAKLAGGRYLLFLNPDTEIVGGAVNRLIQALEKKPKAGLAGAKLLNTDRSLQTSCIQSFPTVLNQMLDSEWLRRRFPRSPLWGMAPFQETSETPSVVEVVSGACILIQRSFFDHLSGFDQRFFMYSEDLDLCHRVHQAGMVCLYVPTARIVHHGGGSSKSARSQFSIVMMRESIHRLLGFHRGPLTAFAYRTLMGCTALVRLPFISGGMMLRRICGQTAGPASLRKWLAILRWSLGMESWAFKQAGQIAENNWKNCAVANAAPLTSLTQDERHQPDRVS